MNPTDLEPRRHEPPPGWSRETFEAVTDALAGALLAACRRREREGESRESGVQKAAG